MDVLPLPLGGTDAPPLTGLTFHGRLRGWMVDPMLQCVAFTVVVSVIFIALPGIDLWFSGLFTAPGKPGFPVGALPAFQILRNANRLLTWLIPIALVAVMIFKLARPDLPSLIAPAKSLFILVTLIVGPGLIANLLFKDHWGRPRPESVDVFGGALPFEPVWKISNACATNCSFISGEGSSAMWLLSALVLVPAIWRPTLTRWLLVFIVLVSLDRIAFGGHFLSDVLVAWGFMLLVMAIAYRVLLEQPIPWLANDRQEERWTQAGVAIRQRLGFPTPAVDGTALLEPPAMPMPPPAATPRDGISAAREDAIDATVVGESPSADAIPERPPVEPRPSETLAARPTEAEPVASAAEPGVPPGDEERGPTPEH
jgi:membrane-associated phospholipid phosphatase